MAKKAENKIQAAETEAEEWVRVDSEGNPLADQAPTAEELEAKLNNLPFILESLVIERNKKLVALVYADYEALDSLGLNNPDNLKTIMDENLKNLNNNVAAYEKVSKIQLYPTEFEKTPKRSIKRYLYNSIAVD